jgi:hypothetical protein
MVNPEAPTCWPDGLGDIANVGLMLVEAKQLLAHVQRDVGRASYAQRARPRTCGEGAPSNFEMNCITENALTGRLHGVMTYVDAVKRFMGAAQRAG